MRRHPEAGVTLIEMLVSLALFAVIAGAGVAVLGQVIRAQTQTEGRLTALAATQRMMLLVARDLSESRANSQSGNGAQLALTRAAQAGGIAVEYVLQGGQLQRRVSPQGSPSDTAVTQVMLTGIATVTWRFLDMAGTWHDQWPDAGIDAKLSLQAVAMTATMVDGRGALHRLVAVPLSTTP
jgi:general secretion pathway protein J